MKINKLKVAMVSGLCIAGALSASAAVSIDYNASLTPINGTGNASTGWSVLTDTDNGIQLGFMGEFNYPSYPNNATQPANPSNGAGTYLFPAGNKPGSLTRSQADAWFSINSGSVTLANSLYNFYISVNGGTANNILTAFPDDAYGTNRTLAGGGTVGTAGTDASLQANNNIAQNAQDLIWLDPAFNPNVGGTENYTMFDVLKSSSDQSVASAADVLNTQIVVAPVPEPSNVALGGMGGLIALVLVARRHRKHLVIAPGGRN